MLQASTSRQYRQLQLELRSRLRDSERRACVGHYSRHLTHGIPRKVLHVHERYSLYFKKFIIII